MNSVEKYMESARKRVDRALKGAFGPAGRKSPAELYKAMRYVALDGGKRLRPIIVMMSGEVLGVKADKIMPAACAIEMIHSSSLIYDDLPSMDDAQDRRGKPCVHKKFSTATAILAANSLLVMAFRLLAEGGERNGLSSLDISRIVENVADVVGAEGMSGGQLMDLKVKRADERTIQEINFRKTAKLFAVSAWVPAVFAGANELEERALCDYGRLVGLIYQYVDDIIDRDSPRQSAGKQGGYSLRKRLKVKVDRLVNEANRGLGLFGRRASRLAEFAEYIGKMA